MPISDEVIECEIAYSKCFSNTYEDKNIIRFYDNQLKDMYNYNYTYIKKIVNQVQLKEIIENEINLRLLEKNKYCNIVLNADINSRIDSILNFTPQIFTNGYYTLDRSKISKLKALPGCTIKKRSIKKC